MIMASILQTSSMRRRRRNGETASSSPIGLSTANDDVAEKEWDDSCKATQRLGAETKFISAGETIPVLGGHTSGVDHALALSLLIVALAVRFFRLSEVQSVVFDEVHYGKFSNWFLSGEYFFDVNPPFGKWVIALVANALGFDPSLDDFEKPGAAISSAAQVFAARAPAAFFGSLTVPVFYWLCRQLHLSEVSSFLGAAFILFDSMHVIQSRMIMVDSLLVFFTCVSLLCALLMWDAKKICILKGSRRTFTDIVAVAALLVTTGVCCGFAVSVRWTAFATPAVVLVVSVFGIPPFCVSPLTWLEVAVLASSIFAAYYGSFAVFLMTASKSGTGNAFMSPEFQMCLQGSQVAMDAAAAGLSTECRMSMWAKFAELNKKIFAYSKGIRGSDKWGSSWFQWCVNWRGALYYRKSRRIGGTDEAPEKLESIIYALMNPAMVICIDLLMALFVGTMFFLLRYRKKSPIPQETQSQLQRGCVLLFGWMGSMLPTMVVYRSGPIYQYLPGLFFAQALSALSFDLLAPRGTCQKVPATVICFALVVAFIYWSPWVYALELTAGEHLSRRWLPAWD